MGVAVSARCCFAVCYGSNYKVVPRHCDTSNVLRNTLKMPILEPFRGQKRLLLTSIVVGRAGGELEVEGAEAYAVGAGEGGGVRRVDTFHGVPEDAV